MEAASLLARRRLTLLVAWFALLVAACHPGAPLPSRPLALAAKAKGGSVGSSSLRFHADYPATLFYALDAASGERNRDAGYRRWLAAGPEDSWLESYAAHRRTWGERTVADAGGGAPAFERCAWTAQSLEDATGCIDKVVDEGDRALVAQATREADARLRPIWSEREPGLLRLIHELDEAIASEDAKRLLALLRQEAGLPAYARLEFHIIVVAKPPGTHTFARQSGQFLIHEVGPDETVGGLLAVAFHEIAHLAHAMSPKRQAMDRGFMTLGDTGRFAANMWDEVVATAFGNGLAAERVDPEFRATRSFYSDRLIDRVGHALYEEWKGGANVELGPALAQRIARLVAREVPDSERTVARQLWYVTLYAEDRDVLVGALRGVDYRSASRITPIDDAVPAGEDMPPWAPRIVLVTQQQLRDHPTLANRVGITPNASDSPLAASPAAIFRHDDADGSVVLVIVASDASELKTAMGRLARHSPMVGPGWTPLAHSQ